MTNKRKEELKQEIRKEAAERRFYTTTSAFYSLSGHSKEITLADACEIITELRGETPYPFYD